MNTLKASVVWQHNYGCKRMRNFTRGISVTDVREIIVFLLLYLLTYPFDLKQLLSLGSFHSMSKV